MSAAGKKKGGRECRHKGDECVERAVVPAPPPSSNHQWCLGSRLRTAKKKERSLSAPLFDACPLAEGNRAIVMGRTPTGRRHYYQTTPEVSKPREGRVPCPSRSTHRPIHQKGRIYTFTPLQTLPLSAETLINEKPLGSLVPGASVPMTRPAHAPPGKAT